MGERGTAPETESRSSGNSEKDEAAEARAATDWCWKMSLGEMLMPARRALDTICMESMESPPRLKKLSWMPTRSMPSTSHHIEQSVSSTGLRAATKALRSSDDEVSGAGRALRSSLPL